MYTKKEKYYLTDRDVVFYSGDDQNVDVLDNTIKNMLI